MKSLDLHCPCNITTNTHLKFKHDRTNIVDFSAFYMHVRGTKYCSLSIFLLKNDLGQNMSYMANA